MHNFPPETYESSHCLAQAAATGRESGGLQSSGHRRGTHERQKSQRCVGDNEVHRV